MKRNLSAAQSSHTWRVQLHSWPGHASHSFLFLFKSKISLPVLNCSYDFAPYFTEKSEEIRREFPLTLTTIFWAFSYMWLIESIYHLFSSQGHCFNI